MNFELILSTESKVLSTNIADFEKQAEQYLATLTNTFETDDDFVQAKEEIKQLKELEDRTRTAIKNAQQGDINTLIAQAENIAEKFRQERLSREKTVKTRETEIKQDIINQAFEAVQAVKTGNISDISLALESTFPKATILKRLDEAAKRRSTLATLTKAIEAEKTLITAEIAQEATRLSSRKKLIPIHYEYLFKDWLQLITGDQELEPIIQERIEQEQQREAEIKAKAEAEQQARLQAEQAEQAKVQAEAKSVADEMEQPTTPPQTATATESNAELQDFIITIRLNQTTQANAVSIARELKARFGDGVKLNKVE
ncbi:hypothetical protein [Lonepinella sp. MS14436]|uniref:hypothetical protein n=1 Tax=Lonepinella sp. MS14436 TaxID=3003619 RepID=UPI0036DAE3E8